MMDGLLRLGTSMIRPSGNKIRASEPVVFATTILPDSRRIENNMLATLDFPRVPVTQILNGIESIRRVN